MDIPRIGLWTWKIDSTMIKTILPMAYEIGYRLFDTAWIYWNEEEIWEGLYSLWVDRRNYWITTKVWFDYVPNYQKHEFSEKDFLYTRLDERLSTSFKELKCEYIDLVLLHWPTSIDNDSYAFEKLLAYKKNWRILHLWVSNFPKSNLEVLVKRFWSEVEYHQYECHAFLKNDSFEEYMENKKIQRMAYSPLWHQHLLKNKELILISDTLWISVSQLCLAYLLKKWLIVLPKASSLEHLEENYEALMIDLQEEILKKIDNLPKNYRYNNPPFAPQWD